MPAAELAKLRGGKRGGPLRVANHSGHAAYVVVDGLVIGWVSAGSEHAFGGLAAGFYRVYAVTPTAVRSWGPLDTYVPGPVTLY